ncbi:MAG: hypothetical protein WC565_08045, partial [Parcubacteria group bacterium]
MSSLALANICPKSPLLSATYGASIEALKGQAFHAIQHKERTAQLILNSLPEDAREEVLSWKPPPTLTFQERGDTVVLDYSQAKHEVLVCLSRIGTACAPTDPKLATEGHVDAFWIVQFQDGTRIAYVGDIKKSAFTSADGPDSLQLMAYGLAIALAERCHGFTTGLYIAEEGEWQWSQKYHELG